MGLSRQSQCSEGGSEVTLAPHLVQKTQIGEWGLEEDERECWWMVGGQGELLHIKINEFGE